MQSYDVITSKDNPTVKLFTKLSDNKKFRNQYSMSVLEGMRLVIDALSENVKIAYLLVTQSAYEKFYDKISQADLKEGKLLVISNELGAKISQTKQTQGVFAIFHIPPKISPKFVPTGKYAVLYGLQDPGNAGMIIRTADALNIDGLILAKSVELYNPKVLRSAMGSVFRVNIMQSSDDESLFYALENSGIVSMASVIEPTACDIKKCSFDKGAAIFIGNEGNGLPPEIVERCDLSVTIHMYGTVNSLNAAMAAGIMMWEMRK